MTGQDVRRPARGAWVEAELVEKRSRFLTVLARADDEDAARAVLARARAEHPQARHHCSAWVLGGTGGGPAPTHSSDDGEPSGTAGRPMLDRLLGASLENVAAVVVRYFGGTLLGTGGLVRAYGDAVGLALERLPLVRVEVLARCTVRADHATGARLEAELRGVGGTRVLAAAWEAEGVALDVATDDADALAARVAELTAGTARVEEPSPHPIEIPLADA